MKSGIFCGLLSLCLAGFSGLSADGLLKNPTFVHKSAEGRPLHWQSRGGAGAVTFPGSTAELKPTTSVAPCLYQWGLPLKQGKRYRCSVEVQGTADASFRFYVEEYSGQKSKAYGKIHGIAATAAWSTLSFTFSPSYPTNNKLVALGNVGSSGTVRFRNLTLVEEIPPSVLQAPLAIHGESRFTAGPVSEIMVKYVNPETPGAVVSGLPVKAGHHYLLSYKVKGVGKADNSMGIMHFFNVRIDFKDRSETVNSVLDDVTSQAFVPKSFLFKVPDHHRGGKLDLGLCVAKGSTVSFQVLDFKETVPAAASYMRLVLTSPVYHHGIFASRPVESITGFAEWEAAPPKVTAFFKLLRGDRILAASTVAFKDGRASFRFPATLCQMGDSTLVCHFRDASGKDINTFRQVITRHPRNVGNEVVIGLDKQFYVNGKLFYPIVHYGMTPQHLPYERQMDRETIGYVSRYGANVFIKSPQTEKDALFLLDLAVANKSMIMIFTGHIRTRPTSDNLRRWEVALRNILTPKVLNHPGLFGFYLADEPRWGGYPPAVLEQSARILRRISPYHPIYIVAAPRGSVQDHLPYAEVADYYGIDIYPVPAGSHSNLEDKTVTCVGDYTRRAAAMVEYRKPVLMILQAFAWGELFDAPLVYPTLTQSRFMAYQALLKGATHIGYYSFHHVVTPSFIDTINAVTSELHQMSALLAGGETVEAGTQKGIDYRVIRHGGNRYAILVNGHDRSQAGTFALGFGVKRAFLLPGSASIAVQDGSVALEVPAYGVVIAGEAPLPPALKELPSGTRINPWIEYARKRQLLKEQKDRVAFYDGKANWIWDQRGRDINMSKVYFGKIIEITKPVKGMDMLVSADDVAELWFDGKPLGKVSSWNFMKRLTVSPDWLKPGTHVLSVVAQDGLMPPSALLADILLTYEDGTKERIQTDGTWRCTMEHHEDWRRLETVRELFKPVDLIIPYGEGAWGRKVMLPKAGGQP